MVSSRILGHPNPRRSRTIWISDVHLGPPGLSARLLLDFLRHHDADVMYLVGDIVDGSQLARSWCWPQSHNDVLQKILRNVGRGSSVVYIPGNHDHGARAFADLSFGGVLVRTEAVHRTAAGQDLWVIHGDALISRAVVRGRKIGTSSLLDRMFAAWFQNFVYNQIRKIPRSISTHWPSAGRPHRG